VIQHYSPRKLVDFYSDTVTAGLSQTSHIEKTLKLPQLEFSAAGYHLWAGYHHRWNPAQQTTEVIKRAYCSC